MVCEDRTEHVEHGDISRASDPWPEGHKNEATSPARLLHASLEVNGTVIGALPSWRGFLGKHMTPREAAYRRWTDIMDTEEWIDQQPEALKRAEAAKAEFERVERESLSPRQRMHAEIEEQAAKEEKA